MLAIPMAGVTLALIAGILLGSAVPAAFWAIWTAAICLALAAALVIRSPASMSRSQHACLAALMIAVGWIDWINANEVISPFDARALFGPDPALARVRGVLADQPTVRRRVRRGREQVRASAPLQLTAWQTPDGPWRPASGTVQLSCRGAFDPSWRAGQSLEVEGALQRPPPPAAPGLFDYRAHLENSGIYFQLVLSSTQDIRSVETARSPSIAEKGLVWARAALAHGLPEDRTSQLIAAMVLGVNGALTGETRDRFVETGTLHIFAISGLHVALFSTVLASLLRMLAVPRWISGLALTPLLWLYAALVGFPASAVRSAVMVSVIMAGWIFRRPSNLANSLAAAALLILLCDPRQLYQAGFQLSFLAVLSLSAVGSAAHRIWRRWTQPDPFLPRQPLRKTIWRKVEGWMAPGLLASIAAWIGTLPVIAYYFHVVTPVSLLANLIIIPLSGLTLTCSLGSFCSFGWRPQIAELFNWSAWFWMNCMSAVCEQMARWPGAYYYVRPPQRVAIAAYYIGLAGCISPWCWRDKRRGIAAALLLLSAAAAALDLVSGWRAEFRLTVLPQNCGVIYIENSPARARWLVNCGSDELAEVLVAPFLAAQGVNRIDQLALTHGDAQRVGGFSFIQARFRIRRVITSGARFRSAVYRKIVADCDRRGPPRQAFELGQRVANASILHPRSSSARLRRAADLALVMRLEVCGARVLLAPDLGRAGQSELLDAGGDLAADIVVASVSGNGESLMPELLDRVHPRAIIISCGEYPASARPSRALRERLERLGVPVWYTIDRGAVTLSCRRGRWTIQQGQDKPLPVLRLRSPPVRHWIRKNL